MSPSYILPPLALSFEATPPQGEATAGCGRLVLDGSSHNEGLRSSMSADFAEGGKSPTRSFAPSCPNTWSPTVGTLMSGRKPASVQFASITTLHRETLGSIESAQQGLNGNEYVALAINDDRRFGVMIG